MPCDDYCPTSREFVRSVEIEALKTGDYPRGTQIMYVPDHAKPYDDSCEYGFIFSQNDMYIFCRFFLGNKSETGEGWERMRTKANSEACRPENIYPHKSRPQEIVDACRKDKL